MHYRVTRIVVLTLHVLSRCIPALYCVTHCCTFVLRVSLYSRTTRCHVSPPLIALRIIVLSCYACSCIPELRVVTLYPCALSHYVLLHYRATRVDVSSQHVLHIVSPRLIVLRISELSCYACSCIPALRVDTLYCRALSHYVLLLHYRATRVDVSSQHVLHIVFPRLIVLRISELSCYACRCIPALRVDTLYCRALSCYVLLLGIQYVVSQGLSHYALRNLLL